MSSERGYGGVRLGVRDDWLHSLAESLSQASTTWVGMWIEVALRVAVAQVAMEVPAMAGAAFLLPGLLNGYGKIECRLGAIEGRLTRIERTLSTRQAEHGTEALGSEGSG